MPLSALSITVPSLEDAARDLEIEGSLVAGELVALTLRLPESAGIGVAEANSGALRVRVLSQECERDLAALVGEEPWTQAAQGGALLATLDLATVQAVGAFSPLPPPDAAPPRRMWPYPPPPPRPDAISVRLVVEYARGTGDATMLGFRAMRLLRWPGRGRENTTLLDLATGRVYSAEEVDSLVQGAKNYADGISASLVRRFDAKANLVNGKVPSDELPSYVDDVEEYASLAVFPATGEAGKIYVAKDTNKTYRWTGTQYTKVGGDDAILTPKYSNTPTFTDWVCSPEGTSIHWNSDDNRWTFDYLGDGFDSTATDRLAVEAVSAPGITPILTATRVRTDIIGYTLGDQSDKPLAPAGEYAKKSDIPAVVAPSTSANAAGKAADAKAIGDTLEALQFKEWFPGGEAKSIANCTPDLKFDWAHADETNHTVEVLPFCNTGDPNTDNSDKTGTVIIPPHAEKNGVRYVVVGVAGAIDEPAQQNEDLVAIVAPTTVTSIGEFAFLYCPSLASVSLPAATSIEHAAFGYCHGLASVSLPAATSIVNQAFFDCTSLTIVSLPAAMIINDFAFSGCTSLTSMNFGPDTRQSVPESNFFTYPDLSQSGHTCRIIVPDDNYDAWTTDPDWAALTSKGYEFVKWSSTQPMPRGDVEGVYAKLTDVPTAAQQAAWNAKQDAISDLSTIRSGAAAGATAYQKPASGIPASDLAPGVIPDGKALVFATFDAFLQSFTFNGVKYNRTSRINTRIAVGPPGPISFNFDDYSSDSTIFLNGVEINTTPTSLAAGDCCEVWFATCLALDTSILMADGTDKTLEKICVGDMLKTPFGPDMVVGVSCGMGEAVDKWLFDDGTEVRTIGRHRFWNDEIGEPVYLEAWKLGEHAIKPDGSRVALVGHDHFEIAYPHKTLVTKNYNLYYANALLAGNRKSVRNGGSLS